jgi:uncharacterized protein DUF533
VNAGSLLGIVVGGLLATRPKPGLGAMRYLAGGRHSFLNTSTLLGAAGLAWGLYEVAKNRPGGLGSSTGGLFGGLQPSPPRVEPGTVVIPPTPVQVSGTSAPEPPLVGDLSLRATRLLVCAARADGQLSEEEMAKIVEHAREAGVERELRAEWQSPRPMQEIVAGVRHPAQKCDLYTLAFAVLRADEDISGAERIFLAQLAAALALDPQTTSRLETEAAKRIDRELGLR